MVLPRLNISKRNPGSGKKPEGARQTCVRRRKQTSVQCGIEHHLPAGAGSSTTVILEMFSCRLTPCLLLHQLNPHCMLPNCTTACTHCRLTHHPWNCVQNATWATRLHALEWHSGASSCLRQRRFIAARLISGSMTRSSITACAILASL